MSLFNKLRSLEARVGGAFPAPRPDPRVPSAPLHVRAAASKPDALSPGRFSNGLREFLWQLDGIGRGNMLDLGAVSQMTLNFFIERGFKVFTEDLIPAWAAFLHQEESAASPHDPVAEKLDPSPAARAERFLSANLRNANDSFDAVLLWDFLDYLDTEAAAQFIARVWSLMRDGGAILAVFHTRMPEQFHRYRVVDAQNLELVAVPAPLAAKHTYQNREIQDLFERFRSLKTFVGRDQFREGVFLK